ncbi:FecR domain-containing protein [Echinicola sp. CAU 1574]|uniref:FecR domain-containing protein n=1 Tax=Echinicola arenosa TaxID=2774144 RepID=A0ABR9AK61_9BACT|nr:FecR domain-containing protein [Echinicola arenosa]MBD8489157.1 FecR domain-containing protein [Echinicola arenosa]
MRNNIYIQQKLLAFIQKKTDAKDNELIQQWLEESEENVNLFLKLKKLYEEEDHPDYLSKNEIEDQWLKLEEGIEKKSIHSDRYKWLMGAAASVLILIAFSVFWRFGPEKEGPQKETIYQTNTGETKSVMLADGTLVWLNAGSKLVVSNDFGQEDRKVTLEGEAWFDVKKNTMKSFVVKTGNIKVKVYGTQFNINAYEWAPTISTSLEEGSISYSDGLSAELFIKPGEQVIYHKVEKSTTLKRFNTMDHIAWKSNKLVLKDVPLSLAVRKIENFYGIQLNADSKLADGDLITMTIENDSPQEIVDLLNTITTNQFTMKNYSP